MKDKRACLVLFFLLFPVSQYCTFEEREEEKSDSLNHDFCSKDSKKTTLSPVNIAAFS